MSARRMSPLLAMAFVASALAGIDLPYPPVLPSRRRREDPPREPPPDPSPIRGVRAHSVIADEMQDPAWREPMTPDPLWDAFNALPITYGPMAERHAIAVARGREEMARGEYVRPPPVNAQVAAARAKRDRKRAARLRLAKETVRDLYGADGPDEVTVGVDLAGPGGGATVYRYADGTVIVMPDEVER